MASFECLAATGKSIERMLSSGFLDPPVPVEGKTTKATLIRTEDFKDPVGTGRIQPPALSVFLYRIEVNKAMRAAWSGIAIQDGISHLPLDLHFLLTAWADDAEFEQRILGRAMQCIETTPILSGPLLTPTGNWASNEAVQVVIEDLPDETVFRTFDSLPTDYKLSVSYIARVVRLDGRRALPTPPVTTVVTGVAPEAVL